MDNLLLPIVAQLNGRAIKDTTEGDWLNLPVRHRVAKETDARVHSFLRVVAWRAEVFCSHRSNLVGMKIDYLAKIIMVTDTPL